MIEIAGKYTTAKIFTDDVEETAVNQVKLLVDNPVFEGSSIRLMPDIHTGKIGPIGFTATFKDSIIPGLIGVDIGCGVSFVRIKAPKGIDFNKLDKVIRENVPSGFNIMSTAHKYADYFDFDKELRCHKHIDSNKARLSIGTLGGGNHFIELDKTNTDDIYLVVHSGSRHLGVEVATYYMNEGHKVCDPKIPYEMTTLTGDLMDDYIADVCYLRNYAKYSREAIIDEICRNMKWKYDCNGIYSCPHNYIDFYPYMVIRKGAISAYRTDKFIIPINMRDGVILGRGKANKDWNYSAPHGAGRLYSRKETKEQFTVSAFKKCMEGVYSTSIDASTLDEAPFAYRSLDYVLEHIKDTVEVISILHPIYNFKAGGRV